VRSKAGKSQLNLPHGTKTKPDMQNGERPESVASVQEKEWGPMVRCACNFSIRGQPISQKVSTTYFLGSSRLLPWTDEVRRVTGI